MSDKPQTYILPDGVKSLEGHGLPYELTGTKLTMPPFGGFFGELK